MSALDPIADMCGAARDVRFGPIADIGCLFDYLISDLLEMHRYVEAQRLGGREVNNKLMLRRRLHWHVCGLFAFEDAIDVTGRLPLRRRRNDQSRSRAACAGLPA